jgi:hypothetical protein
MGQHRRKVAVSKARTSLALSALLAAVAVGGCWWDDDYYDAYYDYYYPYTYYYPVDVGYSSLYYSDYYYYDDWYWAGGTAAAVDASRTGVGGVLRALARGEQVCPGQVTVTPRTGTPACQAADMSAARSGATVVFSGCQTSGGGKLDGTVDVMATRSASEAVCTSNTRITVTHTTKISNLTYTTPAGQRIVVPEQTDTGTNSYTYGQFPVMVNLNSSGQLQVFGTDGTMTADMRHDGARTVSFNASDRTYSVSGSADVQDNRSAARASLTSRDIRRSTDCCHPVGGTLTVNRTGGENPGEHTWTFGPTCGQMAKDGSTITPPGCQ